MWINFPHYVGSTWPSNGGTYNWDAGLLSSWNMDLNSAFSRWGNAGRGSWAPHFGHRSGVETRASNSVFPHWRWIRRAPWASRLRHGLQALTRASSFMPEHEVVLRRGLWALRLGIAMVLRRGLRALRFAFARVALISLTSETWTLSSDDLSLVTFKQST